MKKETKKLIAWIKKILKNSENNHPIEESEDYLINEASAICLLDKFIEVEKQLTKGGIIQDKTGKLCKDGDRIREIGYEEREGVLKWDSVQRCFCFDWDNISDRLNEMDFEKIEG